MLPRLPERATLCAARLPERQTSTDRWEGHRSTLEKELGGLRAGERAWLAAGHSKEWEGGTDRRL